MRTEREIVDQTNSIARALYELMGYSVGDDHKFYEFDRVNYHPHERQCWNGACKAQEIITKTDPSDALEELEE